MFISQVNGLPPSCLDIKSKGMRHTFIFARKSTDVRCEMLISIYIKTSGNELNSLLLKDANLSFKSGKRSGGSAMSGVCRTM